MKNQEILEALAPIQLPKLDGVLFVNAEINTKILAAGTFAMPVNLINSLDIVKFQNMINKTGLKESKILCKIFPELFGLCASIATTSIFMDDVELNNYIVSEGPIGPEKLERLNQGCRIWFRINEESETKIDNLMVYIQLSHTDIVALYKAVKHIDNYIQHTTSKQKTTNHPVEMIENFPGVLFQDALLNYSLPNE